MFNFNLENFRLEAAKYLKIGLPILGSQIVMYGLTTTDYIMAGLYSPNDLAGVGIAASIFNPIYFLTAGIMFGIGPIIAQHFGAKEFILIQQKTRKYLWYGLLIGAIFFLMLNNSWVVFNFLETDTKIVEIGSGYLQAISYGVFAMTIFQALRNYSEGITQTRIIFYISLLIFFLNIPLNYFFIFYLDFGGVGCGYATSVISWLGLFIAFTVTFFAKEYKETFLYDKFETPDITTFKELLRIGAPISFGIFVELSLFSGAALIISFFGATALAAHTIAINLAGLFFMLPLSIGLASAIRVGNLIGEKNFARANYAANFTTRTSLLFAFFNIFVFLTFGSTLIGFYTNTPEVAEIALGLLVYAAIFQIPDALSFSAIGTLRGHKDTFATMLNLVISFWFFAIPVGVFLAFNEYTGIPNEADGMWIGMIAGLSLSAILNLRRLKQKKDELKKLF